MKRDDLTDVEEYVEKARRMRRLYVARMRDQDKMTFAMIGNVLGVSRQRVYQLYAEAQREQGETNANESA